MAGGNVIKCKFASFILINSFFKSTDLSNPGTFRDLSRPVGALNKERLERLLVRGFGDARLLSSSLNRGLCFYSKGNSFLQDLGKVYAE